jgi:nitroreductase
MVLGIVKNDFADVMLGRNANRSLDANFKIPRDEILQMLEIATSAPSAIDSQPWYFLIADTDEGKQKLDPIMHEPMDRGRVIASSFSVVVFADRQWNEHFDEIIDRNIVGAPALYTPEMAGWIRNAAVWWVDYLVERGELDQSVCFQAGLVAMQFMLAVRSHGYECGPMDDWDKDELEPVFGIDLKRFIPLLVIAVGKPTGPATPVTRRDPKEVSMFA